MQQFRLRSDCNAGFGKYCEQKQRTVLHSLLLNNPSKTSLSQSVLNGLTQPCPRSSRTSRRHCAYVAMELILFACVIIATSLCLWCCGRCAWDHGERFCGHCDKYCYSRCLQKPTIELRWGRCGLRRSEWLHSECIATLRVVPECRRQVSKNQLEAVE